jgi:uncharacterized protein
MKITLTLLFCLIGMLIFMIVGTLIDFALYGTSAMSYVSNPNPSTADALSALKILQICQAIGMFIFPGFLVAKYFSSTPFRYLGFNKINFNLGLLTVLTVIIAYPAINLFASLNELINLPQWMNEMEQKAQILTKAFMNVSGFGGVLVNVFMIAILPAIGEELIFRGILQRLFSELTGKVTWGIIISAVLFSGMHLQFQGFIPRLALGILFSYFYVWSGSLWLPILAHFINNLIAIVGYTLIYKGSIPPEAENVGGLTVMWPLGLLSIGLVCLLLLKIKGEGLMIRKVEKTALE